MSLPVPQLGVSQRQVCIRQCLKHGPLISRIMTRVLCHSMTIRDIGRADGALGCCIQATVEIPEGGREALLP